MGFGCCGYHCCLLLVCFLVLFKDSGGLIVTVKKFYRIRVKLCKAGFFMTIIVFVFAFLSCLSSMLIPLFIFLLVDWVITIVPAFYVEVVEKESSVPK